MGRVTGRQRSAISKQPRPAPVLMPWEAKYQHRMVEFLNAPQNTSGTFQGAASPTLGYGSAGEMVSQEHGETVERDYIVRETDTFKDCFGLEVMEETQDQPSEDCERKTYGSSIISDDGKIKPPGKTEASAPPAELPNSPARKQEVGGSGGPAVGPLTSLQQKRVQFEVAFNPHVKQSTLVLKTVKNRLTYNLDEFFNYAFTPGKINLKQRLVSK